MKNAWMAIGPMALLFAITIQAQDPMKASGTEESTNADGKMQYQIVVTATRNNTPENELGSSLTVITARQIEAMQKTTVLDLLRTVPGLDVVQTGGAGGQTSVFIRGAKSEHALILWDGVEINDPSTPGRSFDFANLTTAGIERIEIIRGPQSTLCGSDAMSGVIQIISKSGEGKTNRFLTAESGSFGAFNERAGLSGRAGKLDYALSASRQDTKGFSASSEKNGNTEADGYGNTAVSGKASASLAKNVHADLILHYVDSHADLDNSGGVGGDDPNSTGKAQQLISRGQVRVSLMGGRWEQTIGFSLSRQERHYRNDIDAGHPVDSDRSSYTGRMIRLDWQNNLNLFETNKLTFGVETEQEKGESTYHSESAWGPYDSDIAAKTARTTAGYLQDHILLSNQWFATLGVRLDDHDRFGTKATWRLASSWLLQRTGTRLKATIGTGFKAPSLYQLYSLYGDPSLQAETSTGWDAGIEQPLVGNRLTLDITYFSNKYKHLIDYDNTTWKYLNIGAARTRGIEASALWNPVAPLSLRAAYTFTDAKDVLTGLELLRRPRHKVNFMADYHFGKKVNLSLDAEYSGKRQDVDYSDWSYPRVFLDGYLLVNLAAAWDITPRLRLFARVNNLGDVDYQEVLGYGTAGISGFAGIQFSF
jgi:vitamin B12 transporter